MLDNKWLSSTEALHSATVNKCCRTNYAVQGNSNTHDCRAWETTAMTQADEIVKNEYTGTWCAWKPQGVYIFTASSPFVHSSSRWTTNNSTLQLCSMQVNSSVCVSTNNTYKSHRHLPQKHSDLMPFKQPLNTACWYSESAYEYATHDTF